MLDKFRTNPFRLQKITSLSAAERARIGVIRHRVANRLDRARNGPLRRRMSEQLDRAHFGTVRDQVATFADTRRRAALVAATVLALLGMLAVAVSATAPGAPGTAAVAEDRPSAEYAAMLDRRAAAERADRAAREQVEQPGGASRAAAAQPSPTPAEEEEEEEEEAAAEESSPDWVHPMPEGRTTSCYGMRWGRLHGGVDLAAPHGTPIRAVGAGRVSHAGWVFGGYGISVVIDHGDGVLTHYAHASEANVSVGDQVSPGDVIALEGSTGDSTGPHLHFEVHVGGLWNQVEPTDWMSDRGVSIGGC